MMPIDTRPLTPLAADILRPPGYLPMSFAEWDRWRYPDQFDWDLLHERDRTGVRANGMALVAGLLDGVVRAGVQVRTGTRLTGIRDGVAELAHGGQVSHVRVGAVILATGGFDWDQELRLIYQPAAQRASGAPPTNTGDGLRIAADAGAGLDNLAEGWWMPMLAIPGETLLGEQFYRSLIRERGLPRQIMVNAAGRRFVNEALPYNEIGKALHRELNHGEPNQGQDGPVHLIFDEGYRARYPMPGVPGDGPVPDWVGHGRTLGELAARIGASTVALAETVRRWNVACAAGWTPSSAAAKAPTSGSAATRRSHRTPAWARSTSRRSTRWRCWRARSGPRAGRLPTPTGRCCGPTAARSPACTRRATWPRSGPRTGTPGRAPRWPSA